MDKRWTLAIVTLLMVLLIYSFLSMVLKSDKKKTTHSRMYRDYSNYTKKDSTYDSYVDETNTYASSARARKLKRSIFNNTFKATQSGYSYYMNTAFSKSSRSKEEDRSKNVPTTPQYDQMMELSRKPLPELQKGVVLFRKGEYEEAISSLNDALEKLDPMEIQKRIEVYSLLAECYIKLKDDDGYIQNKIRQVRFKRKYQKLMKETFPGFEENDFMTTQQASTNLIRIRSSVANLPDSPMVREMVKKAELDLEVARKVTQ